MGDLIKRPFATAGTRVEPPQTDQNFNVNFEQGYTPQYEIDLAAGNPDAKAVERPVMNYLFWLLTSNTYDWQRKGFPQWYSDMPGGYTVGAHVTNNDVIYRSIAANNSAATTDPASWEKVLTAKDIRDADTLIRGAIPMPYGGDKGEMGAILASGIDFNEQRRITTVIPTAEIFNQCTNKPPVLTPTGGILESLVTVSGATLSGSQLFVTMKGETWTRAIDRHQSNWSTWTMAPTTKQIQDSDLTGFLVTGPSNQYVANPATPLRSYAVGQQFTLNFPSATAPNTGKSSINISGLGALTIQTAAAMDILPGTISASTVLEVILTSLNACQILSAIGGSPQTNQMGEVGAAPRALGFEKALVPIGFPMACPSTLAIPRDCERMRGQTFSASAYPELAKVYPSLIIPEMRAVGIRGVDDGRGIDLNRILLTEQNDMTRAHSHTGRTAQAGTHGHAARTTTPGEHNHDASAVSSGNHAHGGTTESSGQHQHYSGFGENTREGRGPWGDTNDNTQLSSNGGLDRDNSWWLTSPDGNHAHNLNTTWNGEHSHSILIGTGNSWHEHGIQVDNAGEHDHSFTTDQTGGAETVGRNVAFIWVCRVK